MPEDRWHGELQRRLRSLRLKPVREAEIAEELSAHLDDRSRELVTSGATQADAPRLALEDLASPELAMRSDERHAAFLVRIRVSCEE